MAPHTYSDHASNRSIKPQTPHTEAYRPRTFGHRRASSPAQGSAPLRRHHRSDSGHGTNPIKRITPNAALGSHHPTNDFSTKRMMLSPHCLSRRSRWSLSLVRKTIRARQHSVRPQDEPVACAPMPLKRAFPALCFGTHSIRRSGWGDARLFMKRPAPEVHRVRFLLQKNRRTACP